MSICVTDEGAHRYMKAHRNQGRRKDSEYSTEQLMSTPARNFSGRVPAPLVAQHHGGAKQNELHPTERLCVTPWGEDSILGHHDVASYFFSPSNA